MPSITEAVEWLINPKVSSIILISVMVYLLLLWAALIVWTAKDIISRTNNIPLQIISIVLVVVLNVFGVIIYLAIRPSKTLIEKFFEDLEYEALSSSTKEKPRTKKKKSN